MIKTCTKNIFETSTVTLPAGTVEANYPLYRLYDRKIALMFKADAAETTTIHLDQGASGNLAADRFFIPSGHNLTDLVDIQHSPNDVDWTNAVPQFSAAAGQIVKSWDSVTKRYWRVTITSPSAAVEIPEIFLTQTYEFERNPARPVNGLDDDLNVINETTAGGDDRFLINGVAKKRRQYNVQLASETQKTNLDSFYSDYAGAYPFWLEDIEGEWIYGKLIGELNLNKVTNSKYNFNFNFLQVIS